jgi:hypothetical protein
MFGGGTRYVKTLDSILSVVECDKSGRVERYNQHTSPTQPNQISE